MLVPLLPALRNASAGAALSVLALLGQAGDVLAGPNAYEVVREPTLMPGDPIPEPTGPVVLEVTGRIKAGENGTVRFDMATLERIGLVRFATTTAWTEEPVTFDGVLLSRMLEVVGADPNAASLVLTALNDYHASMPISDARQWPVILAIKENGDYMSMRRHGPIWVVYPQHAYPELNSRKYVSRWVWQLARITVE
jgi:hypothetical protein